MKKVILAIAGLLICVFTQLNVKAAAVIHCDTIVQTSLCPGATIVVPFTVTSGSVPLITTMTAQLSDWLGSFAAPVNIGTSPVNIGIVTATIPTGTAFGFLYRVRIIANTSPEDTSSNSPNTLIIAAPLLPDVITSNPGDYACTGDTITLSTSLNSKYLWMPGSDTTQTIKVTSSGSYTCKVTNIVGCSVTSPAYPVYFRNAAVPVISQSGPTLTSSHALSYQWNNTSGPIPGANSQSYTPPGNGTYSVTVHDSLGCTPTSIVVVYTVGVNELSDAETFTVFPNPASESTHLKYYSVFGETSLLSIYNVLGEKILEQAISIHSGENMISIDLHGISPGVYLVAFNSLAERKIKTLVIQ